MARYNEEDNYVSYSKPCRSGDLVDVFYLCDGKKCFAGKPYEHCGECRHTTDILHAKNFPVEKFRKTVLHGIRGDNIMFVEQEDAE